MICDEPLTEEAWLAPVGFDGAAWMIRRIWQDTANPSARKSQLFACACARQTWEFLAEPCRTAVELAERHCDGGVPRIEMETAARAAAECRLLEEHYSRGYWASIAACVASQPRDDRYDDWKAVNALRHFNPANPLDLPELVREIMANPFRPTEVHSAWRTPAVVALAKAVYDDRALPAGLLDSTTLSILADALEEIGSAVEIVNHCRRSGPHVRGCWAIDSILGLH